MAKKPSVDTNRVAFVYVRISKAKDGVSLEMQEAKCRLHAEREGWPVAEVISDGDNSGKDGVEDRPGLALLLKKVQETPGAVIVVYSISRLARRQHLLWSLLDDRDGYGLAVSSATERFETTTPMGRAMLGMIAVFAQLEADMVAERTRDALAELKSQGKKLGAPSMTTLNADIVRQVKELYATGAFTHRSLADELNLRGIPTTTGNGKWWPKTVRTALLAA